MEITQTSDFPEIQFELELNGSDEVLTEAIDQAFTKLGAKVKPTLYSILEAQYKLNKKDLSNKTLDFVNALEQIFGASSILVEIFVMKSIRQQVPLFCYAVENDDINFLDYLESLKSYLTNL